MNERGKLTKILVKDLGERFSSKLGIDLSSAKNEEIFKWFLASILFGARISEAIVVNTYKEFEKEGVISPLKILKTGWDGLVKILDKGGYVRYDFKTATKLLEVMRNFEDKYGGDFSRLEQEARNSRDLEEKVKNLGKGIGEVTVGIFLRELRGLWQKANPPLSPLVFMAARNLRLLNKEDTALLGLEKLRLLWKENQVSGKEFADFEVALLRLAKDWCRRGKCKGCIAKIYCPLANNEL